MGQSVNYEKVETYYNNGCWNIDRVFNAVGKWITEEEYKEITTFVYPDKVIGRRDVVK